MKLVAAFAFRYDAHLVADLLENISFCDDVVSVDDTQRHEKWYHEGKMRQLLREKAREAGADWILCVDPDERFEKRAGKTIRMLIASKHPAIYRFHFRELYSPHEYRTDGVWGSKSKDILFPLLPNQKFLNLRLHAPWAPTNHEYTCSHTGLNLYHLKMIDPANRQTRKELYQALDPDCQIQSRGYEYLTDEQEMTLERIPPDRLYEPAYRDDYAIRQLG